MRNLILVIIFAVLLLWGGSTFIPQVRDVVVESPPAIVDASIVAPIPMPRLDRTAVHDTVVSEKHYVQVGSYKTRDDAFRQVDSVFPKLGKVEVRKVHLDSGTWYRVLVPTKTLVAAKDLCSYSKSIGIDCIVLSFKG